MHVYMPVITCVHACEGQRSTLGIFLNLLPLSSYYFEVLFVCSLIIVIATMYCCASVCTMEVCAPAPQHVQRAGNDNRAEPVLPFHLYVGSGG